MSGAVSCALRAGLLRFADARRKIMAFAAVGVSRQYGGSGCAVRFTAPLAQLRTSVDVSLCSARAQRSRFRVGAQANWKPEMLVSENASSLNQIKAVKRKRVSEDAYQRARPLKRQNEISILKTRPRTNTFLHASCCAAAASTRSSDLEPIVRCDGPSVVLRQEREDLSDLQ